MKYQKAAKGIRKIFISQLMLIIITVPMLIITVLEMLYYKEIIRGDRLFEFITWAELVTETVSAVVYLAAYVIAFWGIINASHDDRRFKQAIIWVIAGVAVYFGVNIAGWIMDDSVADLNLIVVNVMMMVVTLSVIDGSANLAERMKDNESRTFFVRGITVTVIAYLITVTVGIINTIFTDADSYTGTLLAVEIISHLLTLAIYVIFLVILRRAGQMLRHAPMEEASHA